MQLKQNQEQEMENFLFPEEIPIDVANNLDQSFGRFRGVKDGLPELIKNSKDQYSRLAVLDGEERLAGYAIRDNREMTVIIDTEDKVLTCRGVAVRLTCLFGSHQQRPKDRVGNSADGDFRAN